MTAENQTPEAAGGEGRTGGESSGRRMTGPGGRRGKFAKFGRPKTTVEPEEPLDYKNIGYLQKFIGPTGKIHSRRRSGFSGQNQRKLANAIKVARALALLPFVGRS
ncbi:MAG: 30S ribosomal protein S18 [Planctomycetota bacterium]|jgi:small subunit ribosomal protein S18|nr:30S ribosomal protein S18 [Planctomycetota bacterium]MDA0932163.1 30S ribosomal protein S18 [Planctomycetota bacterium]MDA1220649.1 30S ribosomal protein S18 [Planctomycetota bacterium]